MTLTKEHERMTQSTQRKIFCFNEQTKNTKNRLKSEDEDKATEEIDKRRKIKDGKEDEKNQGSSEGETENGHGE